MSKSSGGWWGWTSSWSETIVNATNRAVEICKQDLAEFSSQVTEDTTRVINGSPSPMIYLTSPDPQTIEKVTAGISGVIGQFSGTSANATVTPVANAPTPTSTPDKSQKETKFVQTPKDSPEFAQWCATFKLEEKAAEVMQLLQSDPQLRLLHSELVPSSLSELDFWQNHFFQLIKGTPVPSNPKGKEIPADDEDLSWGDADITENSSSTTTGEKAPSTSEQVSTEPEPTPTTPTTAATTTTPASPASPTPAPVPTSTTETPENVTETSTAPNSTPPTDQP
ncbi:hypothetical protein Pelo_11938 [Pelomyxa schiedti]|nr:hypothetical protein Pelo_11938 [Pelomyxa schiedti]